jgi:hypothetical protein
MRMLPCPPRLTAAVVGSGQSPAMVIIRRNGCRFAPVRRYLRLFIHVEEDPAVRRARILANVPRTACFLTRALTALERRAAARAIYRLSPSDRSRRD